MRAPDLEVTLGLDALKPRPKRLYAVDSFGSDYGVAQSQVQELVQEIWQLGEPTTD